MKGKDLLTAIMTVGLFVVAFSILFILATNKAQHADSLTNVLSNIVSGMLGAMGGGAMVAHAMTKTVTGDVNNITPKDEESPITGA